MYSTPVLLLTQFNICQKRETTIFQKLTKQSNIKHIAKHNSIQASPQPKQLHPSEILESLERTTNGLVAWTAQASGTEVCTLGSMEAGCQNPSGTRRLPAQKFTKHMIESIKSIVETGLYWKKNSIITLRLDNPCQSHHQHIPKKSLWLLQKTQILLTLIIPLFKIVHCQQFILNHNPNQNPEF